MAGFPLVSYVLFCITIFSCLSVVSGQSPLQSPANTLSVPLKHNVNHRRQPHWEYYRTLQKYNIEVPERLREIINLKFPNKLTLEEGVYLGVPVAPDVLKVWAELRQIKEASLPSDSCLFSLTILLGSTIPAISHGGDLLWLAPIQIGTPPQTLYLDLDTGSTDTSVLFLKLYS